MNIWTAVAAGLMLLTFFVHVFGGGPEVYTPVRGSDLPIGLVSILSVIWHAISVILLVMAAAYGWAALHPNGALIWTMATIQIGFAGLFIYYGITDLGTVWPMPQWAIFLLIPTVAAIGQWRAMPIDAGL